MGSNAWILGYCYMCVRIASTRLNVVCVHAAVYVNTRVILHFFCFTQFVCKCMKALCICCCLFLPVCVHECECVALRPGDVVLCIDSTPSSLLVSHSAVPSSAQQQARSQTHSLLNYEMHVSCLQSLLIIFHSF